MPRNPQARRKKTTRKSDRRELRAILRFPSLRACFHPSYCAEYTQYITLFRRRLQGRVTVGNRHAHLYAYMMRRASFRLLLVENIAIEQAWSLCHDVIL